MEGWKPGYKPEMFRAKSPSPASLLGRRLIAGAAGTVVMTAFQKLVEMPLTKRGDSYAPADMVGKVTPVEANQPKQKKRLNYVAHLGFGLARGAVLTASQPPKACAARRQ